MKEKIWKDCPVCGAKGTMKRKSKIFNKVTPLDYQQITVGPLSGQFCSACNEGFLDRKSIALYESQIADGKALQDSQTTHVSDVIDAGYVAKIAHVSRQRVNKMMAEGKLPFVYVAKTRYPIRQTDDFFRSLVKRGDVPRHIKKTGKKAQ
jgi:YgiT-type zinc finger domain-containing protein